MSHNSTSKGSEGQKFTQNLSFFTSLQFGESYMPFSFSISVVMMGLKVSLLETLKFRIICKGRLKTRAQNNQHFLYTKEAPFFITHSGKARKEKDGEMGLFNWNIS